VKNVCRTYTWSLHGNQRETRWTRWGMYIAMAMTVNVSNTAYQKRRLREERR
jgi:hypothetical protein